MSDFIHAPQHRHEALIPFSRDHYTGLKQAQQLRKAADANDVTRRKAVAEFIDAWDQEIAEHFRDEERLLLHLMQEEDRARMLREHERLTQFARQLLHLRSNANPNPVLLKQIGEMLEKHIRWEERELFNCLQDQLDKEQLDALHQHTGVIELARLRNVCQDHGATSNKEPS